MTPVVPLHSVVALLAPQVVVSKIIKMFNIKGEYRMKGTKKNLFKNSLSLAIRAMIGMTAMSLLASAHAETSTLEEIVVTAQKR